MKVTVNLKVNDLWQGNKFAFLKVPKLRGNFLKSVLGIPIGLLIVLFVLRKAFALTILAVVLTAVVAGFAADLVMIYITKMKITKRYKGDIPTRVIEIRQGGVAQSVGGKQTNAQWKNIISVTKNEKYIFFVVNDLSVYIIPKREFESAEAAGEFYDTADKYWKASDKAKKK